MRITTSWCSGRSSPATRRAGQAPPARLVGALRLLARQVLVEEEADPRVGGDPVREPDQPVPLVLEPQVLDDATSPPDPLDDLLGLADWHPRVVRAVDHHQRRADPIDLVDRRDLREEVAVSLEAAVLGLAELPAPRPGVLEEGDEVGDADDVHRRRPE